MYKKSDDMSSKITFKTDDILRSITQVMYECGYITKPVVNGKINRFQIGDKRNKNGWYCFHADGIPAGVFGNWVTGDKHKWCMKSETELTTLERTDYHAKLELIRVERKKQQASEYAMAALEAQKVWDTAADVTEHPYLKKKQVQSIGLKQCRDGRLVVPVYGADEKIQSLQYISDSSKQNLPGGKMSGGWYCIDGNPKQIAIVEGYATGATVHQSIGYTVYIAFNAGNMLSVANIVNTRHIGAHITICCDNDQWTDGNPGLTKGREAAHAIGASVAVPIFKDVSIKPTDFNDLMTFEGIQEVKRQIEVSHNDGPEKRRYACITGRELMTREFKEPAWFLQEYLPKGLSIFGGKPKAGKSLIVGNLVIAVATGGMFFNLKLEQQTVLLLGLEDTYRRLQDRFRKMTMDSGADLSRLIIFNEFAKADQGGMKDLEEMILLHKPALVVIDTLKKFKSASNVRKQLYDENYDSVDEVKKLADKYSITIILVHHLRKMESEDPFDTFSGSLGLTAAADNLWVMQNGKGGMVLSMTGRDMEPLAKAIKLHAESLTWHILGNADEVQKTSQQQAIFDCLKNSDIPLKPKDVHGLVDGIPYDSVRKLLKKLFSANKIALDDKGMYSVPLSSSLYNNNENFEYTDTPKEKDEKRAGRADYAGYSGCAGRAGTVTGTAVPHDSQCKNNNLYENRHDRHGSDDKSYSEHRNEKTGITTIKI